MGKENLNVLTNIGEYYDFNYYPSCEFLKDSLTFFILLQFSLSLLSSPAFKLRNGLPYFVDLSSIFFLIWIILEYMFNWDQLCKNYIKGNWDVNKNSLPMHYVHQTFNSNISVRRNFKFWNSVWRNDIINFINIYK